MGRYELRIQVGRQLSKDGIKRLREDLWRVIRNTLGKSAKGVIVISSPKI